MKRIKLIGNILLLFLLIVGKMPANAQSLMSQLTPDDKESYLNQANAMVKFLEGSFNDLGDPELYPSEKLIIINETYLKYFRDNKVQIEDDLDDERKILINKDVQAYLKDIDFFFKEARFEIVVEELELVENASPNFLYVKVKTTRTIKATTIDNKPINSTKTRFLEINVDPIRKDLKIASYYSRKISEDQELKEWWTGLPNVWRQIFITGYVPGDTIAAKELSRIINLENVDISGKANIYHIEPLSRLRKLKSVNISNTLTKDLNPLRNLTNLETLKFAGTSISDVSPLKFITSLKEIDMAKTPVANLEPLTELQSLIKLDCNTTQVSDLSPLSQMLELVSLDCSHTQVTDISPIENLQNLKNLLIAGTAVSNTGALAKLANLENLNIEKTKINSLNDIRKMAKLKTLYCAETSIIESEINKFIVENTECLVVYKSKELASWWNPLSVVWKNKFKEYIKVSTNPTLEQLHQIVNLKSIDLKNNSTITDLAPLANFIYLKELNCSGTGIISIEPLQNLTYLEDLDCSNTKITDISPLVGTVNLRKLNINNTGVTTIAPLTKLTMLEEVYASNTLITDINALVGLKNLKKLHVDNTKTDIVLIEEFINKHSTCFVVYRTKELESWWNSLSKDWIELFNEYEKVGTKPTPENLQNIAGIKAFVIKDKPEITNLNPLKELKQLQTLTIVTSGVEDLRALKSISTLEEFVCTDSPITHLLPLTNMKNLKKVEVNNSALRSLKGLEKLVNITHLGVSGCKVRSLRQLKNLSKLEYLDCSNSRVFFLGAAKQHRLKTLSCYNTNMLKFAVKKFKDGHKSTNVIYY